ncbi:hypothetical protein SAMN04488527_109100 [Aliiroseovarius crassostreae]|uniref:Uncharacterized protein n=1 Tax=Aliiroseovarius crassostreae TaxID=154981 RepID=A0A0N8IB69_9RHOB|nr:hypothetical protein [Aliiroseovarius crassostreae]KPN62275.1 hypothetical protein AKJ29_08470 [Aliiroseovarius crassostreae]SFU65570.1 hypothetical protein SAMN04488527_109100 [Aliiroseovarius crassostreae]
MDENSNLLDEMARDAEREPGDAKKAWRLLATHISETSLPNWVKEYVQKSARAVSEYDMEDGDQAQLAHRLGFFREVDFNPGANYDLDDIFDWFTTRMMKDVGEGKKINISRTAREYREENRMFSSSPGGIRKAYEKARARHARQLQDDVELDSRLEQRRKSK